MHEQAPLLQATRREQHGSRYCQRVRKAGGLPAVVYGHGREPISITLDSREAVRHFQAGEKVFRLDFPGKKEADELQIVLLKDLQFDYLGTNIVHADFARVDLNERVRTRVAIHLIGESKGLKTAGAILMHPVNEIEIECLVLEIPEFIEVSITDLDAGQVISAGDVKLPSQNMKLLTDPHSIVAQIVVQVEVKVGEEAAAATSAEPVVLTAKKPAEGEAAKPGAKPAAKK
ncbi:MAG: 50S ribosomal protein L25 [Phycisphaeraceae bacterium]|nr:50S ribosomal protein L25 [Phycisphaeraceae bacterium]